MRVRHVNTGDCPKCKEIVYKYGEPHLDILVFYNYITSKHKDAHVAFVGRGKKEQEEFFAKGTSKAKYGQSPHNYNAAIDFFRLTLNGAEWPKAWFDELAKELVHFPNLEWGGSWKRFIDRPHFEVKGWKELTKNNSIKLVE